MTFSKLFGKKNLGKEILKKCTSFKEQKGTRDIQREVFLGIIAFSCFSFTKLCLRFLLICFAWEIKGFYKSSLGNEVDFRDIMNASSIAKIQNLKKLRQGFVGERTLITATLIPSCRQKTLVPFCLRKKRPEKAFLTIIVMHRNTVQKNKLCHPKQQQLSYSMTYDNIYSLVVLI